MNHCQCNHPTFPSRRNFRFRVEHFIAPHHRLAIALGQCSERAACPEGIAYIANRPLDAAFLIAGPHLTGLRGEVIVRAQLEQTGIELNLVAAVPARRISDCRRE